MNTIGNTSLQRIDGIYFKCEFENPSGSHKDRAITVQLAHAKANKYTKAVISSSGNAAISAALFASQFNIELTVFVGHGISKGKRTRLEESGVMLYEVDKPLARATRFAQETHAYNLRQSTDPVSSTGYQVIATEVCEENKDIDAIFIPVSSATAMQGIYDGYLKIGTMPALHAVQTEKIHPIASHFDSAFTPKETSLASAIVAVRTVREPVILAAIHNSKGFGWVMSDASMKKAHDWLREHNLDSSYEGAAALSAYWKSIENGYSYRYPTILLTGRYYVD